MEDQFQVESSHSKSIKTLIPDIYRLLESGDEWFTDDVAARLSRDIATRLKTQLSKQEERRSLRLSAMGPKCPKALWASVHCPELRESLPAWATIKYSFGHVIECLAIELARAAGHEVTGEQNEVKVDGIVGHRDCVIDGCVVDVKSSSSRGFSKFKDGSIAQDDNFGYLDQLDGYLVGSAADPLVRTKDRGYLFVVDKQLGHLCLFEHKLREDRIRNRIAECKNIVSKEHPPQCECRSIEDGMSGNLKLDVKASYNPYKYFCRPSLRTFIYSNGPRYLTHVQRLPDVPELDSRGKIVYH